VAWILGNLAQVAYRSDRPQEAEAFLRQSLAINEASFGPMHPSVGKDCNDLGVVLSTIGSAVEAERYERRALEIVTASLGRNHPDVALSSTNLATLLGKAGRFPEAITLMRQAIAIAKQVYGGEHAKVGCFLGNLATLLKEDGQSAEALQCAHDAAKVIMEFETISPDVDEMCTQIANVMCELGDFNGAADVLERQLDNLEALSFAGCSVDLPMIASICAKINHSGQTKRISLLQKLQRGTERLLGPDHFVSLSAGLHLASMLMIQGQHDSAEDTAKQFLDRCERIRGKEDSLTVQFALILVGLYSSRNDLTAGRELLARIPSLKAILLRRLHGESPDEIQKSLASELQTPRNIRSSESAMEEADDTAVKRVDAEPLMRRALQIAEHSYGGNHPDVAICLNDLASLLQATNRLLEAEPLYRRAVEITVKFTRETGHPHPHLKTFVNNYAGLLHAMGKSEAEIRKVLSELGRRYGVDLGGLDGRVGHEPSPKLRVVLEEIMRDPSKINDIAARLQREDPALFQELVAFIQSQQEKAPEPQPQTTREQQLLALRQTALKLYRQGDYAKAEEILRGLVEAEFEMPTNLMHLARLCLITNRDSEAKELVVRALSYRANAPVYTIPRLLWFQLALDMLEQDQATEIRGQMSATILGRLKTALQNDEAFMEWTMQPVLDHLHSKLGIGNSKLETQDLELLTALVAALNDAKNLSALDAFPVWRDAIPQTLE
jgi:tetratricopeptide (TPR) repeat protein